MLLGFGKLSSRSRRYIRTLLCDIAVWWWEPIKIGALLWWEQRVRQEVELCYMALWRSGGSSNRLRHCIPSSVPAAALDKACTAMRCKSAYLN